ncbi:type VI secretion system baseplate subunit TssG [Mesorhizobium sp.]|uniref:type VI secretion system baseplate subunit TssG n=1 Tax=Mesorhizobium sp. TaxID=1871066 RepID=UPI000FE3FB4E|nr:type VI secretion system baseplate subunit TssG [Mesorhizobium sp.]RWH68334.1 MAG: type VI secretion system baseplate subunit TssG [Mesorhizobium sp.]RWL25088.1 MAG: type VI secretion system baseplate subunit TssG [Mesorhizobium sp.]RWL27593.1 MAG: type VI secretion system baseplate subunit TssG [Mesorhizobium sp.]RWL36323.1 MAG: type VI secretion system baseplate subunit TssG [Mesorhizobium sp.]RWL53607.1 MAG: type VI secretion system baseplate subunit TssG [Mesorhizobium sp.]
MADDARQSLPDLAQPAPTEAEPLSEGYDFFELLRRLEQRRGLFGHSGTAEREPARLGQHVRLSFTAKDVVKFQDAGERAPARVTVANLGLLGPEGPMPLHLTRWVLDRLSQRWFTGADAEQTSDTTFVDFVNILQHRMIALYYRAWADAHPAVQVERSVGGRVRAMLEAMAGIGLPGTQDPELDTVRLRQAGSLANQVDGAERLTLFLATAFKVPVEIKEFVAAWITIPQALQSQVGKAYAALGRGATIGPRVFSRQSRIELRVGPLNLDDFKSFLPGERRLVLFKKAVRDMIGEALDVDLRIVLARDSVPSPKMGTIQLGRTSWLSRPAEKGDADDLRLRTIVGWRPDMAEAA